MFQQPQLPQKFRFFPLEDLDTSEKVNYIYHGEQTLGLAMLSNAIKAIDTLNKTYSPAVYPGCQVGMYLAHVRGECAMQYGTISWFLDAAHIHFSNAVEARIYAGYTFFGRPDRRHVRAISMLSAERDSIAVYADDFKKGCEWVFDVYQHQYQFPTYLFAERKLATGQKETVFFFPEESYAEDRFATNQVHCTSVEAI